MLSQRLSELVEGSLLREDTSAITKLKQDELELTRKIFARVEPTKDAAVESRARHDIDPYWSPFHQVKDLKEQVTAEFDEYQKYVGAAEAKRVATVTWSSRSTI